MNKVQTTSLKLEDKDFIFESGKLAQLADGAVKVTYGDIIILATAQMSDSVREGMDFFPLVCEFEAKYYATGKIKGSRFMKREGRAADSSILIARMMDRPIRPMFPKGILNEVQIIATLLQSDGNRSAVSAAITGASLACLLGGMPLEAPISAVRVGIKENGEFFLDPTFKEVETGALELVIAGTEDAILMVEAGANLISNEKMIEAFEFAHKYIKDLCVLQKEFLKKHNIVPRVAKFATPDVAAEKAVHDFLTQKDFDGVSGVMKRELKASVHALEEKLLEHYAPQIEAKELSKGGLLTFCGKGVAESMRRRVFSTGKRIDGRGIDEVRPISVEVDVLPLVHGTGLFQRGDTQALSVLTVGGPSDAQILDDADRAEFEQQYMHHYNFPPFSVGETRPLRGPGRREIGHGALSERALRYVVPRKEDGYPYTLRVVSEILACNGSSSMASVCGSTLALMDGGIPIKTAIAGVAMGLMTDDKGNYKILTDIQGAEDFGGDMDLKVCGDENNLTALQMDIKIKGLDLNLIREALEKAKAARQNILKAMKAVIAAPRAEMKPTAPRIYSFHINPEFIRVVIGKGGETIQKLCADFEVKIDIEDDGLVMITSVNGDGAAKARRAIESLVYEPKLGDVFDNAVVKSVKDFGAFVEYIPGHEALVHVSEISDKRVENVADVLKEGQIVKVKIIGTDKMGRIQLSMKAAK